MASFKRTTLYINNTNVAELQNVRVTGTEIPDTGATASVIVYDSTNTPVSGETWPVAMPHVSDGTYRGSLSELMELIEGERYVAVMTVVGSGASEVGRWEVPLIAVNRRGC